jgi:hypothetical protein
MSEDTNLLTGKRRRDGKETKPTYCYFLHCPCGLGCNWNLEVEFNSDPCLIEWNFSDADNRACNTAAFMPQVRVVKGIMPKFYRIWETEGRINASYSHPEIWWSVVPPECDVASPSGSGRLELLSNLHLSIGRRYMWTARTLACVAETRGDCFRCVQTALLTLQRTPWAHGYGWSRCLDSGSWNRPHLRRHTRRSTSRSCLDATVSAPGQHVTVSQCLIRDGRCQALIRKIIKLPTWLIPFVSPWVDRRKSVLAQFVVLIRPCG